MKQLLFRNLVFQSGLGCFVKFFDKCRRVAVTLLLTLFASLTFAQPSPVLQQTEQLLDWLGVLPLIDQIPMALTTALDAEARARNATPQQAAAWRRQLEPRLQPRRLKLDLAHYVAERYRLETFRSADALLQQPLAKRARYFELAMTQPGAGRSLKDLRAGPHSEPTQARRELVQEIDAASASSALTAVLQTAITERVRLVAGDTAAESASVQAQIEERQRYLEPLTQEYLLYAYRYLRDDELIGYRDLLRDASLQWLLDVSRQGVLATLAEVKPPPDSPR
jgi:hypothetical protein